MIPYKNDVVHLKFVAINKNISNLYPRIYPILGYLLQLCHNHIYIYIYICHEDIQKTLTKTLTHIYTCSANQGTGFYMITASVTKELKVH